VLRSCSGQVEPSALVAHLGKGVRALADATDQLLAAESRQQSAGLKAELVNKGAPDKLADRVAHLFELDGAVGLARLSRRSLAAVATFMGLAMVTTFVMRHLVGVPA